MYTIDKQASTKNTKSNTKSASNANATTPTPTWQAHKHKNKRPTRRATAQPEEQHNQHEEQRKQACNLHRAIVLYNAIFYQTKTEGTNEGTNEKKLSILPAIETAGKRENTPPD